MKNKIIKFAKYLFVFLLPFLFEGCFLTYYSTNILPKGQAELGGGLGAVYELKKGPPISLSIADYDNPIYFARYGIGNKMDVGLEVGVLYMTLDIRKQILEEAEHKPAVDISGNINIYSQYFGVGGGPGVSVQLGKGNFYSASKFSYAYYWGRDIFSGEDFSQNIFIFVENMGYEIHVRKHFYIIPLVGIKYEREYEEEGDYFNDMRSTNMIFGVSFLFR